MIGADDRTAALRVLDVLKRASGSSMARSYLAYATGLSDRNVREAVNELVRLGHPVVSDREVGGYALTRDGNMIDIEVARLRHQAGEITKRAAALEKVRPTPQKALFR